MIILGRRGDTIAQMMSILVPIHMWVYNLASIASTHTLTLTLILIITLRLTPTNDFVHNASHLMSFPGFWQC